MQNSPAPSQQCDSSILQIAHLLNICQVTDLIPEASFRPSHMTKSRPSKKEGWKTPKGQVETAMARKRTRSIAIATEHFAYSLSYHFTAEAHKKKNRVNHSELWCTPTLPHHCIPLSQSQTHLSASRIFFLSEGGGGWWLWHQWGEWAKPLVPPHPPQGLQTKNKDRSY